MTESKNSFELFKRLNYSEIYDRKKRPIIVADDIRTPENMGAIIRLAGNIGALKVIFISDLATDFKSHKIKKTASGAAEKIEWVMVDSFEEAKKLIPNSYNLVAIETSYDSKNIFMSKLAAEIAFIVGNEVKGIRNEIINEIELKYHIPNPGPISSLNVTHSLSIALFEWLRQNGDWQS